MTNESKYDIIDKHDLYAPVAQLVEHLTFNQRVRDSSSRRSTKQKGTLVVPFCLSLLRTNSVAERQGIRNIAARLAERDLVSDAKFPQEHAHPCGAFLFVASAHEFRCRKARDSKNTRHDIDRTDVVFADDAEKSFSYIGDTKDGRRCYTSGFDKNLSMDDRIELFKTRIATIFNLGAVELKTDVKKIRIRGDRFTSQKNLFGDKQGDPREYETKINSLYDLADILATATYDPTATNKEPSYNNPNVKPKNAAHKNVKYWYKFRNKIVFDGVPYEVTFNIRDKGKDQYQYLIDFKEDKTPGLSNTAVNNLLRADQASYISSIPQPTQKSNTSTTKSSKNSSGKQYALDINSDSENISGAEAMGWLNNKPESDGKFDLEATVARGLPYKRGKSDLTVGELRKVIANTTHEKVYSKSDALKAVNKLSGTWGLTVKARDEIADTVWQFLNEAPDTTR